MTTHKNYLDEDDFDAESDNSYFIEQKNKIAKAALGAIGNTMANLKEILTNKRYEVIDVGFVSDLVEGGLAMDYIDRIDNTKNRYVIGFTELGCWEAFNDKI
jgi:hypothetical protein